MLGRTVCETVIPRRSRIFSTHTSHMGIQSLTQLACMLKGPPRRFVLLLRSFEKTLG
jgi:hypothetical protein